MLTIGGLDPSGGAGLPADARAIAAFGAHACGVATAVIAQNTQGVARVEAVSPEMLAAQLDNILEDIMPRAVKVGMLPDSDSVKVVVEYLRALTVPIIVDPVFAPSSGPEFSGSETIAAITTQLLPIVEMVTPNIVEAERLLSTPVSDSAAMQEAARAIGQRTGTRFVLIKGGHLKTDTARDDEIVDVLFDRASALLTEFRLPRIDGYEVRGTGCMLASAIAAQRAQGVPVEDAVWHAKSWLTSQMSRAIVIGKGRRVISG